MNDDIWFRKPEPLGWPLAALGFVVGLYASELTITLSFVCEQLCLDVLAEVLPQTRLDLDQRLMVALVYALSFGLAGRWVSARLVAEAPPLRSMLFAVFAGAQMAGCIVGVFTMGRAWGWAALVGVVASLASAPFAMLLAHNGRWAWRAREGSLLHASYRRARWIDVATAVVVLLALYANPMFGSRSWGMDVELRQQGAILLIGVAVCAAALLALRGTWSLIRVARARHAFREATAGDEEREHDSEGSIPVFDVGVGDDRLHDVQRGASAYRHATRIQAVCVGDLARAGRVLGMAVGRAAAIAMVGGAILALDVYVGVPLSGMCG